MEQSISPGDPKYTYMRVCVCKIASQTNVGRLTHTFPGMTSKKTYLSVISAVLLLDI